MKKGIYEKLRKQFNNEITDLQEKLVKNKADYIESNKPCNIGDEVSITLKGGRKAKGIVRGLGILANASVCITSYSVGRSVKYITTPHGEVVVIKAVEI